MSAAVASVIEGLVASAAQRAGISTEEALHLAEPEQIAELIARADGEERHASVRPLREDRAHAEIASVAAGQLINALSQAAKMAVTNGDSETAVHAVDLLSELGSGISSAALPARISTERGVLAEAAQILDRSAEAFEAGDWSTCPCGQPHGQQEVDKDLPKVFRADAELARQMLLTVLAEGG